MKKILLSTLFYSIFFSFNNVFSAIPTFDFTNFTQAVESLVKAISFYNSSLNNAKQYINQIEVISKEINKGDITSITNSISSALELVNNVNKDIDTIVKYIEDKRNEAELKSKKSTLEIISLLTNPSLEGYKTYIKKNKLENKSTSEKILTISKDTKKAIELLKNDYDETTKKALEEMNIDINKITKKLNETIEKINKLSSENSTSIVALESISGLKSQYDILNNNLSNLIEKSNSTQETINITTNDFNQDIARWDNIIKRLDIDISTRKKLNNNINNLVNNM